MLQYILGIEDTEADVKQLVTAELSYQSARHRLTIQEKVNDVDMLCSALDKTIHTDQMFGYLMHSYQSSILFTSRTTQAASDLAQSNVIQ